MLATPVRGSTCGGARDGTRAVDYGGRPSPVPARSRPPIETRIVKGIRPADRTPRQVARELRALVDGGARLVPTGEAREDPEGLLADHAPRVRIELFDALYYLSGPRYDDDIGFFVAYVALREGRERRVRRVHPRIFYKDLSLVWRVATHLVRDEDENWIGKGDLKWERNGDGEEVLCSAEETTNLPLEIQGALDEARGASHPRRDLDAVPLVLRRGPRDRVEPYADFTAPRRRAAERHRVHGGRRVARFTRRGDPSSLRFARGYEPDFARGVLEMTRSASDLYRGAVRKYRVLSRNREVQYPFVAAPTHVWMNPPQALTTELSTYGVRTVDVAMDEEAFVPGFEYHFDDADGELHSQIPEGFAGDAHPEDEHRADASAWIEALPVVQRFRAQVLGKR